MSIVAELEIPSAEFVLGETLAAVPETNVEFERVVTHGQEWIMPFLWARGPELAAFERRIGRDPTVSKARVTDRFDGRVALFRVEWDVDTKEEINSIFDMAGTLVEATGNADTWDVVVRFDARDSLSELQSHFEGEHTAFELKRIYSPERPSRPEFNLTPEQVETLVTAVETGYFAVPKRATLADVAERRGVSTTATSECLRRAVVTLTRNTLQRHRSGTADRDDTA